ncbi:hypothetical protein ACFWY9_10350 [Amycolatopsis sp. NPDC059027]|uniref:hypothetical protein n=1 Tax=Amycolatopsis sp. NPDC059027 TaxID=3346709 RepID=UPI00366B00B6
MREHTSHVPDVALPAERTPIYDDLVAQCSEPPAAFAKQYHDPTLVELLEDVASHWLKAGHVLKQATDLVRERAAGQVTAGEEPITGEAPPTQTRSSDAHPEHSDEGSPLLADCRSVFDALGADRLPSGALALALRGMFGNRWPMMTKAKLATQLPAEVRPVPYTSSKRLYLRQQFYDDMATVPSAAPTFLQLLADYFAERAEDALPAGWLHDHWMRHCDAAKHINMAEFLELLRIHDVRPDWTKSGHFVRASELKSLSPNDSSSAEAAS